MSKDKKNVSMTENVATRIAEWVGTPMSIVTHTLLFLGIFTLRFFNISFDKIMLILTTLVSLEAIYLSLFIQMTVNQHSESLEDVEEDIDSIQEHVEDISEDIDDVQEDVEGLESNLKEIQEDVEGIEADVGEIADEGGSPDKTFPKNIPATSDDHIQTALQQIALDLSAVMTDIKHLKEELGLIKKDTSTKTTNKNL